MTDLFHKANISLSSVMEPTRHIEHVSSIKRSGLVSSGISLVIANHISERSYTSIRMVLLGMPLDPRDFN